MINEFISQKLEDAASAFKPTFNIYEELDRLYEGLRIIQINKEIINTEWWGRYKKWALDNISTWDTQIVRLSVDPHKNERELVKKHSLREAMSMLINLVENTVKGEAEVEKRKEQYEKITKLPKPQ
jgi:hypothetical protein